jgi:hypothetical protein
VTPRAGYPVSRALQSKLRKKLENDGEDASGVYARPDTTEELDDSKVYRIILRVVVSPEAGEDVDREKRALGIVSQIRKLLAQCSGINGRRRRRRIGIRGHLAGPAESEHGQMGF